MNKPCMLDLLYLTLNIFNNKEKIEKRSTYEKSNIKKQ